jgi:hypothetical protein
VNSGQALISAGYKSLRRDNIGNGFFWASDPYTACSAAYSAIPKPPSCGTYAVNRLSCGGQPLDGNRTSCVPRDRPRHDPAVAVASHSAALWTEVSRKPRPRLPSHLGASYGTRVAFRRVLSKARAKATGRLVVVDRSPRRTVASTPPGSRRLQREALEVGPPGGLSSPLTFGWRQHAVGIDLPLEAEEEGSAGRSGPDLAIRRHGPACVRGDPSGENAVAGRCISGTGVKDHADVRWAERLAGHYLV